MRVVERNLTIKLLSKDLKKGHHRVSGHDRIVVDDDNTRRVYLWNTQIAKISDGKLELFNGGYVTKTTNSRLNAILGVCNVSWRIVQKNCRISLVSLDTNEVRKFTEGCTFDIV